VCGLVFGFKFDESLKTQQKKKIIAKLNAIKWTNLNSDWVDSNANLDNCEI